MNRLRIILLVGTCLVFLNASRILAQDAALSPNLSELANRALTLACSYAEADTTSFDAVMVTLGGRVSDTTYRRLLSKEDESMQVKVSVLAYYRMRNQLLYDNLINQFYIVNDHTPGLRSVGGPSSPKVTPEYMTEQYRPIWEYLLLNLGRSFEPGFFPKRHLNFSCWRPNEALDGIKDKRSLIVLDFVYEKLLSKQINNEFDFGTLGPILESILRIGSAEGDEKEAFLLFFHCYTLTEKFDASIAASSFYHKSADDFFLGHFGGVSKASMDKWKIVARAYPSNTLTSRENKFIQAILNR